ncbi:hypothetical protein F5Y19DRAFT_432117 [Xylariaceae sp. FL1651]|nr:hypothetical protein F5Y19DRAFT_432117 [Xylariaceae sp. FL1651]
MNKELTKGKGRKGTKKKKDKKKRELKKRRQPSSGWLNTYRYSWSRLVHIGNYNLNTSKERGHVMAPTEGQEAVLYFAYGSNLSTTQMRQRCPRSPSIGLAYLSGWAWVINERGYANIVKRKPQDTDFTSRNESAQDQDSSPSLITDGAAERTQTTQRTGVSVGEELGGTPGVYGVVYRLHPADEEMLDLYEGVPDSYEHETLDASWADSSGPNLPPSTIISSSASTATRSKTETGTRPQPDANDTLNKTGTNIRLLAYVDYQRVTPSAPKDEYVGRMNRGIEEAMAEWGLPAAYVDQVLRPFIPAPTVKMETKE